MNKRKRQAKKNAQQAAYVKKQMEDAKANRSYGPAQGVLGENNNENTTYMDCKYSCFGCVVTQKSKVHKTNRSKWCLYHNKEGDELQAAIDAWKKDNDSSANVSPPTNVVDDNTDQTTK